MTDVVRPAEFDREMIGFLPALKRLARHRTRCATSAEDLVQDTVARACMSWPQYQPGTNMRAWLMTILVRLHINGVRTQKRRSVRLECDLPPSPRGQPMTLEALAGADGADHEERERLELAARAIEDLPNDQRETLEMIVDGMKYEEIAFIFDLPVGTVKSRVSRARDAIQAAMMASAGEA